MADDKKEPAGGDGGSSVDFPSRVEGLPPTKTPEQCKSQDAPTDQRLPVIDKIEAERFLNLLDPGAAYFTFQAFDDDQERGDKKLARVIHGTLNDSWNELVSLNDRGAGIFITVNETDLQGRKAQNVKRVRALFIDLDEAPLDP